MYWGGKLHRIHRHIHDIHDKHDINQSQAIEIRGYVQHNIYSTSVSHTPLYGDQLLITD